MLIVYNRKYEYETKLTSMKNYLSFFLILIVSAITNAQDNSTMLNQKVLIKPGKYKLIEVIEKLNSVKGLNITYDANSLPLQSMVSITDEMSTVAMVLDNIQKTLPVEYQVKGNYIILKKKKSNTKFKITGMVTDSANNAPMAATSIYIKGETSGTVSNDDGSYSISLIPGEYTLVYRFIGYNDEIRNINLAGDVTMNISLSQSTSQIGEVRVTKQRDLWGKIDRGRNISSLDSKKIELLNNNNATDALQASMPGVWSTSTSGAPGDHQKVVIRGLNTLFGCTDPLYIIDGVAVPIVDQHSLGIADLNIYDIENITVLKDASSTSLYGYQGGNGVVIIDTKRYNGESHISFSTKFGVQSVSKRYDLMDTKDFLAALDTASKNGVSGIRQFYPPDTTKNMQNTNWQNTLFQLGIIHEYQLSGSGNFHNYKFYISGNYYTHGGIIANSDYSRYTVSANVGRDISKKLSIELNVRSSLQSNLNNLDYYMGNNLILQGINKSPLMKSTPDSFYYNPVSTSALNRVKALRIYFNYPLLNNQETTDSLIKNTQNALNVNSNTINLMAKFNLTDDIFINGSSSVSFRNNFYSSSIKYQYTPISNNYMKSNEHYLLFNQQLNLSWHKTTGDNEFIVVAGYRNYADNAYWNLDTIENVNNLSDIYLKNSLAINGNQGSVSRFIQSFAAHVNYNYKKKYFVSLVSNYESLTIDNFNAGGNFFPSVALIWDISKEDALKHLTWLSQFNVYGNWGIVGNYPLNALSHDFYTNYNFNYYDTVINGKAVSQLANHFLKQEIINEYNFGTNVNMFNNRIKFTADYYLKNSTNLVIMRDIPLYYGGGRMFINLGKLQNTGIEFSLDADVINTANFEWLSSFAISTNRQRVSYIGDGQNQLNYYTSDVLVPEFEVKANEEVGVIKGYKYEGSWSDSDAFQQNKLGLKYPFVHVNGDKFAKNSNVHSVVLNDSDKVILGKTLPDYTWHWTNTFVYKNFSCEFVWYGVAGVSKYNATRAASYMAATNKGTLAFLKIGQSTLNDSAFYQSSFFVENASFIRLKQLTFAYCVPKKIYKIATLTLSLSFENLVTITPYSGYDPEASIYTDNSFSDFAVDRGAYPNPKSVYFTLKLDF